MAFHQIKSTEIGELSKRFLQVTHVYDSMMELPWRFQPEINQWINQDNHRDTLDIMTWSQLLQSMDVLPCSSLSKFN